ncbi:MAG: ComF family protein [Flavobacteriaceae bacterium]|nr:ComF family protein [Flavobacteriaceae bacterium]
MILKDLFNLFFPKYCICCDKDISGLKSTICLSCQSELPFTDFSKNPNNELEQLFYGRIPLEAGTALFYFKKDGKVQQLIHHLKYKGKQEVGKFSGELLSGKIVENQRFSNIDMIIPVPLHPKKQRKRGYNQLSVFGNTLSEKLHIPYEENVLKKVVNNVSQTHRKEITRWENVENVFFAEPLECLKNAHILLIDDVITSGATLESCYLALKEKGISKISIASIAFAERF